MFRWADHLLLSLVHELAQCVNANKQTDMAILDFPKAFDKVSHKRLLYKLQWYGVNPQTHAWIADFLRNRSQAVVLEGETLISLSHMAKSSICIFSFGRGNFYVNARFLVIPEISEKYQP